VSRRRVSLLHRQARVVARPVETRGLSGVDGISAAEVFLVDAVAQRVGYSAENRAPYFAGGHFAQLDHRRFRVEGGVRGDDQVRRVFQWRRRRHQVVGLALVNVEGRGADAVVLQGRGQGGLVDKAPAGSIDQKCTCKENYLRGALAHRGQPKNH